MKIACITSGAAGMFCGSCMKDNTLAAALIKQGHDALLIPTYTPIRTDEEDVSQGRVFLGGINVYLQQKSWLFRHTPRFLDRMFDIPRLLRWAGKFAVNTKTDRLGGLAASVLQGRDGKQRKEMQALAGWLADEFRPDVVLLSNVLISGFIPLLCERWNGPVIATLQGDDIFLDALPTPDRHRCIELIRDNCRNIDGYIATSQYYADFMAEYLGLAREKIDVVQPGLNLAGHGGVREVRDRPLYTIGYFARICPEKGFHLLAEAFRILRKTPGAPVCRLRISGWLGENHRPYFDEHMNRLRDAGLGGDIEHVDSPSHSAKVAFLQSLDVLSVPTTYREPKGIYILEALANGVPVVQPRHGAFPELIEATGGGLLVEPNDPAALADGLRKLLDDVELRRRTVEEGGKSVRTRFTAETMAEETANVLARYHQRKGATPIPEAVPT